MDPKTPGGKYAVEVIDFLDYIEFKHYFYQMHPEHQKIFQRTMGIGIQVCMVTGDSPKRCALFLLGLVAEWLKVEEPRIERLLGISLSKH